MRYFEAILLILLSQHSFVAHSTSLDDEILAQETKIFFLQSQSKMEQKLRNEILALEMVNLELERALTRQTSYLQGIKNELLEFEKRLELEVLQEIFKSSPADKIYKSLELLIVGLSGTQSFFVKNQEQPQ